MAEVKIRSSLDSRGFRSGVNDMKGSVKSFESSLSSIAGKLGVAFGVGQLASLAKEGIALGSKLSDLAVQTQLTTDEIQALELAALKAGTAPEKIRTAISKLNVVLGQAKRGMKTYIDLFGALGISQERIANLNTQEAFELVAKAMTKAEAGTVEFGAAMEILGTRSATQLLEVLDRVANEGLGNMIAQGKAAGLIIDGSLIKQMDDLADSAALTGRQIKLGVGAALGFFAKGIRRAGRGLGNLIFQMKEARFDLRELQKATFKEDFEEAAKAAKKKEIEEKQRLAAVAEEQAKIRKQQEEADKKRLEEVAKLQDKLNELEDKAAEDKLSTADKILKKEQEIAAIKKKIASVVTDPVKVDPVKVDPVEVDPVKVDPVKVDPVEVKPVEVDPVKVDPVKVDPVEVKPVEVDPVKVKPVEVKPVEVKPVEVKPVEVDPVEVKPVEVKQSSISNEILKSSEQLAKITSATGEKAKADEKAILQAKIDLITKQKELGVLQEKAAKNQADKDKERLEREEMVQKLRKQLEDLRETIKIDISQSAGDRLASIGGQLGGQVSTQNRNAQKELQLAIERNKILQSLKPEIRDAILESGTLR